MSKLTSYQQVVKYLAKEHINFFKNNPIDAKTLIKLHETDKETGSNEVYTQLTDNLYIELDICEEVIKQVKAFYDRNNLIK